jgi:tetratricopeptide (TPR) repeat protein
MQRSVLFVLAVFTCAAGSADEIYLKGGGRVSGRVVQRTATSVEIDVGGGTVAVPAKQVDRIVEGRCALDVYNDRAGALAPKDRDGWAALGRWASDQGLSTQSREAYYRVLAIDPADVEANQALGNVQVNGQWMTEEASYRARGYVQFEGEWMTPAEQQAIQRERAQADSDRARAQAEARARQAEAQAAEAEARAKAAEKAAEEAQQAQEGIPLWWGWGPGPYRWPRPPTPPRSSPPRAGVTP